MQNWHCDSTDDHLIWKLFPKHLKEKLLNHEACSVKRLIYVGNMKQNLVVC